MRKVRLSESYAFCFAIALSVVGATALAPSCNTYTPDLVNDSTAVRPDDDTDDDTASTGDDGTNNPAVGPLVPATTSPGVGPAGGGNGPGVSPNGGTGGNRPQGPPPGGGGTGSVAPPVDDDTSDDTADDDTADDDTSTPDDTVDDDTNVPDDDTNVPDDDTGAGGTLPDDDTVDDDTADDDTSAGGAPPDDTADDDTAMPDDDTTTIPEATDPLIDDLEDSDNEIPVLDERVGFWFVSGDEEAMPPGTITEFGDAHADIDPVNPGLPDSTQGLHVIASGFTSFALIGVTLNDDDPYLGAVNYSGITFWAKHGGGVESDEIRVDLRVPATEESGDHNGTEFTLTEDWMQYTVLWDDVTQRGFGPDHPFVPEELQAIHFSMAPGESGFDLWLDDLAFLE